MAASLKSGLAEGKNSLKYVQAYKNYNGIERLLKIFRSASQLSDKNDRLNVRG